MTCPVRLSWRCEARRKCSLISERATHLWDLIIIDLVFAVAAVDWKVMALSNEEWTQYKETGVHYWSLLFLTGQCLLTNLPFWSATFTFLILLASKQNVCTCFSALWHTGALVLWCLSYQKLTTSIALPTLWWHFSRGGCRSSSSQDQCWPRRGLHTQPLQNFQCPRTLSGKLPACSVAVSPTKNPVSITIP